MSAVGRIKPKVWTGIGHPQPSLCAIDSDFYIDTTTKELWLFSNNTWFGPYPTTDFLMHSIPPGPTGPQGPTGPCCTGPTGPTGPAGQGGAAQQVPPQNSPLPTGPMPHGAIIFNKCSGEAYRWDSATSSWSQLPTTPQHP